MNVPDYVSRSAERGLKWHAEGKSGDGVTDKTVAEARAMAGGNVSEDKLRRMNPWFQRHRPDMDAPKNNPENKDFPGAGAVAWALWGGPTSGDIMRTAKWAQAEVERLDAQKAQVKSESLSKNNKNAIIETNETNTLMPEILISDIDGTVLDGQTVIQEVVDYIKEEGYTVVFLTNRSESERNKTEEDLKATGLDYSKLIMNSGDKPAPEYKVEEIQKLLDAGYDPQEFIDNSEANRTAVEAMGIEGMEVIDPADIISEARQEETEDSEEADDEETAKAQYNSVIEHFSKKLASVANFNKTKNTMTIEEQLKVAIDTVASAHAERDEVRVAMEALVAKEQNELKELSTKNADLSVALDKITAEHAELLKQVAELTKNQISASAEAAKIASSVGVDPVEIAPADAPQKTVSHTEAFLVMTPGAERSAYYAKYKNEIIRGL